VQEADLTVASGMAIAPHSAEEGTDIMKSQEAPAKKRIEELLYQALETEMGGVEIYRMAILCAKNADLKAEWTKYLAQTERHVAVVRSIFDSLGLDAEATTPGRQIVRDKGKALLSAMQKALKDAPQAAQIVAAECVVDAETKDHGNWQLIGAVAETLTGTPKKTLMEAYEQVEDEEDEHLYHTKGWARELWLDSLGLPADMPPPEERKEVKSAAEAARAAEQRKPNVKRAANGGRRPQPRA
jgi:ferritin-like metal-binding protein YciE